MPKYDSPETIPARLFFEIKKSRQYMKLCPKPKEAKDMEALFLSFEDYYFLKSDNPEAKRLLKIHDELKYNIVLYKSIENVLKFLTYNKTTKEMRYEWIDLLAAEYDIVIDKNKDFLDELHRVVTQDLAYKQNDINMLQIQYDGLLSGITPSKDEYDYYDAVIGLGNAHQRTISEEMSLSMYISYENSAKRIHKEYQRTKQAKNGK